MITSPHIIFCIQNLYQIKRRHSNGVGMDAITIVEWLQALLVLVIFLGIIAVSFKIWRWNYVIPPK